MNLSGKNVALLLPGPSVKDLESYIDVLKDLPVMYASCHECDEIVKFILQPAERKLNILGMYNGIEVHKKPEYLLSLRRAIDAEVEYVMLSHCFLKGLENYHRIGLVRQLGDKYVQSHLDEWGSTGHAMSLDMGIANADNVVIFGLDGNVNSGLHYRQDDRNYLRYPRGNVTQANIEAVRKFYDTDAINTNHWFNWQVDYLNIKHTKFYNANPKSSIDSLTKLPKISVEEGLKILGGKL